MKEERTGESLTFATGESKNLAPNILDSSLITTTKRKAYNVKLVTCGSYIQVYLYNEKQVTKNIKKDSRDLNLKNIIKKEDTTNLLETKIKSNDKKIADKNIIRSKLECQRIAKANMKDWNTFITLTFADNITDIDFANKKFNYFINKVRRVKKDFKYIVIPEFQKRGAVHFHLLTNIEYTDNTLIYTQEDNKKFKHIKFWNEGFTSIEKIKKDAKKIIGYISKYMTKDIDQRLFGKRRYHCSNNLNMPTESYINLDEEKDLIFYNKKIQDLELIYQNTYINTYDNTKVTFLEFLK